MRILPLIATSLLITSCAWVELTPEGEKVRVLEASEVADCKRLGHTTSSGKDKILAAKRHDETVLRELRDMARNSAAEIKGDTIVTMTEVKEGKQTFAIYKCL